jgi:hypothetical protein
MSNPVTRVIYAGNTVLVSDSPAASQQTGLFSLKLLNRVQSTDVSVSSEIKRRKHFGDDTFVLNNYLTSPNVTAQISYISQDNSNESILGLSTNGGNIYQGQNATGLDKNLFFLFDTLQENRDLNKLSNYTGIQVLGLGNAQITNYSTRASVGELPTSSISFVANNVTFQNYDSNKYIPSISPSGETTNFKYNIWSGIFDKGKYISNYTGEMLFVKPGDIQLIMQQPTTDFGGIKLLSYTGKIQSYDINIPFTRRDNVGFGNNYPYSRKLMCPEVGTISMSVIFDGFNIGNYSGLLFSNRSSDFTINLKDCEGNLKYSYLISDVKLANQNFATQIGSDYIFDGDFEFPVGFDYGFAISGNYNIFDYNAQNYLDKLNIIDTTTRNAINKFVVNLKNNNLWYKMSGIYPLIGDSADINKYNLKNPTDSDDCFRLGFSGSGTIHSSISGVNFAGTGDYANVFFNPYTHLSGVPVHISALSLSDDGGADSIDIGCVPADLTDPRLLLSTEYYSPNSAIFDAYSGAGAGRITISDPFSRAFYTASRITNSSGFMLLFSSSTTPSFSAANTSTLTSEEKPNFPIFFGAVNKGGSPYYTDTSNRKFGFFSIGDGLTSGQCVNLYSAVKQLQFDLNRNQDVFA